MNRVIRLTIIVVVASLLAAAQTPPPPVPPPPMPPPPAPASPASPPSAAQVPATPRPPRPPRAPRTPRAYAATKVRGMSYLGVDIRDITPEQASALKLKNDHGAEITMVDQDAPAGKAGLKEHDVIVAVNGTSVVDPEQLRKIIHDTPPGRNVTLGLVRNGQPMSVNVQLAERGTMAGDEHHIVIPRMDIRIPEIDIPSFTMLQYSRRNGLMVENLTPQLGEFFGVKNGEGVLVRSVEKGSRGEVAGFRAGDVIVKVGSERVSDTSEWNRLMRQQRGGTVPVTVIREKREQNISLTVPQRGSDQSEMHFDFPDISEELAQLGPELQRTQQVMAERIQREVQQHQKDWQANADKAQRQAQKQIEQARRELEKAMRDMQRDLEKDKQ